MLGVTSRTMHGSSSNSDAPHAAEDPGILFSHDEFFHDPGRVLQFFLQHDHLIFFFNRDKNTSLSFYDLLPKESSLMKKSSMVLLAFFATLAVAMLIGFQIRANGQQHKEPIGYQDTPMLPGGKWHVHDGRRPQPPIVTPGTFSTQETPGQPPSDAVVLFDGRDLSAWQSMKGGAAGWP